MKLGLVVRLLGGLLSSNTEIGDPGEAHDVPVSHIRGKERGGPAGGGVAWRGVAHLGQMVVQGKGEGERWPNEMLLGSSSGNMTLACRRERNVPLRVFALKPNLQAGRDASL